MPIDFSLPDDQQGCVTNIKVIGVGGGGGNAVNHMYRQGVYGVEFIICNTDLQVLRSSPVERKIQLGLNVTRGLGAGSDPSVGRESAMESLDEIRQLLGDDTNMVVVVAGMGGGTGTGAAPVIASIARELGILTVGIVTTPFKFEGPRRRKLAEQGIAELMQTVDTAITIKNDNLLKFAPKNLGFMDAMNWVDDTMADATRGISEIITREGHINVDFADLSTTIRNSGTALMGIATVAGENRAEKAVEEVLNSPLLDNIDIAGANGILINISGSPDSESKLGVMEVQEICEKMQEAAGHHANCIFGSTFVDNLDDAISVTVIATGFAKEQQEQISGVELPNLQDLHDQDPHNRQSPGPDRPGQQPNGQPRPSPERPSQKPHSTPKLGNRSTDEQRPSARPPWSAPPKSPPQPPRQPEQPLWGANANSEDRDFGLNPEEWADAGYQRPPHSEQAGSARHNSYTDPAGDLEEPPRRPPEHLQPAPPPQPEQDSNPLVSRMERIKRISQQVYNYHDNNRLLELEDRPAFIRRGVKLNFDRRKPNTPSRNSFQQDGQGGWTFSENNPYMHDQTD